MTINANQRVENVVIVGPSDRGDAHTAVTKIRLWNEDGTPFALKGADNKVRLDALEARIAALEGNQTEEVATDDADGADGDVNPDEQPAE